MSTEAEAQPRPVPAPTGQNAPNNVPEDPVARRLIWRDSADYVRFAKSRRWIYIVVSVVVLVGGVIATWLFSMNLSDAGLQFKVLGAFLVAAVVYAYTWIFVVALEQRERKVFEERLRLGMLKDIENKEQELADRSVGGEMDLASLWAVNQGRIEYYHNIALGQAESSYKYGQIAAIVGFLAVVALGAAAALATNGTASIAAAAVGVAGAAMSAYIGSTFMKIHAASSNQFGQFFQQPVEFSRILGAERLINTLDQNQRADSVHLVIKAMMAQPVDSPIVKSQLTNPDRQ